MERVYISQKFAQKVSDEGSEFEDNDFVFVSEDVSEGSQDVEHVKTILQRKKDGKIFQFDWNSGYPGRSENDFKNYQLIEVV